MKISFKILIGIFSLIFFLKSCRIPLNEYGQPKRFKDVKQLNVPDSLYRNIDTLALYKFVGYEINNTLYKPNQLAFIRFFSNEKLVYSHGNEEDLSKEYFRPARGKQGRYFINKEGKLSYYINTSGEGWGYGVKGFMETNDESLIMIPERNYFQYYEKMNIDQEWLDWQPD